MERNIITQKMKFSVKDFLVNVNKFAKKKLPIYSYLLKKSLTGKFIFYAVSVKF